MKPLVSVLMPVYNAEKYLAASIGSILAQTYGDFELLICDDASTDGSLEIVRSFDDTRMTLLTNRENLGNAATRNRLIEHASGEYVAVLDADDTAEPDRLARQVDFLERNPEIGLCGSWVNVIGHDGERRGRLKNLTNPKELRINLLFSVPFIHSSVMARADLMKSNPYDPEFRQSQDYELWCRLADLTLLANIPEYLVDYRWHYTNISITSANPQNLLKREVNRRQILKLGIEPSERELDLHQAAFLAGLYAKDESAKKIEPKELEAWFEKLVDANNSVGRYPKAMFRAYVWSRWMVFCYISGHVRKAFFPSFASPAPAVSARLIRFILHFAGKRM